ncbi:hypothetical protein ACWDRB_19380 [Nonomuraea sp. NPDC003707]
MLVRQGALTAVRRTASTAAPVQVTVGFAVLVTGMVETNVGANGLRRIAAVQADWVLAPQDTPGPHRRRSLGRAGLLHLADHCLHRRQTLQRDRRGGPDQGVGCDRR